MINVLCMLNIWGLQLLNCYLNKVHHQLLNLL